MQKNLLSLFGVAMLLGLGAAAQADDKKGDKVPDVLNFKMKSLAGKDVNLADYKGKVVLFVNVASYCGYTKQYKGLEELHEKYGKDGLVVIGVPCNEFGSQEPGTAEKIEEFCSKTYGVKFPMMEKSVVNGAGQAPLYKYLTSADTDSKFAGKIKWNFTKFLIGRDGTIVSRFEPKVTPESPEMVNAIEAELKK